MVAVGSKSIPEKQSISLNISKNSENNLEEGLFSDIFSSENIDAKKIDEELQTYRKSKFI